MKLFLPYIFHDTYHFQGCLFGRHLNPDHSDFFMNRDRGFGHKEYKDIQEGLIYG